MLLTHKTEMDHQHMQKEDTSLVLSSDAKPRLKWTPELHQRFIDAVTQLGGAKKATPKNLDEGDGHSWTYLVPPKEPFTGTSFFLKYRLAKSQQSESYHDNKQEVNKVNQRRDAHFSEEVGDGTEKQINESLKIAQALQMQMEVQRKLHEQIEVQRHLQLRIEAQGKYLQTVLKKAQETLAGYSSSSAVGVELAKAELSQLVSMVDNGCQSSSLSVLTDIGGSSLKDTEKNPVVGTGCSLESSLTSSESSGRMEREATQTCCSLTDGSASNAIGKGVSSNRASGRKRSGSTISDGNCPEGTGDRSTKSGSMETFDLNSQYLSESDPGPEAIDLN